jgi:hypothetical protein
MKEKLDKRFETYATLDGKKITIDQAKQIRRDYLDKKKNGYKPTEIEKLRQEEIRILLSANKWKD